MAEIAAELARAGDAAALAGRSPWRTLDDVFQERKDGSADVYTTGLQSIDAKIEGGLPRGSVTVIQGKPGVGKTALATQIALSLGRTQKCAVAALYADEGMAGAAITIGQQLGVDRLKLKRSRPEAIAEASRGLRTMVPIWRFLDPQRAESTLEFLYEEFPAIAGDLVPVYLLDSGQIIRSTKQTVKMGSVERLEALCWQVRELTLKQQAIALFVSHVNRSAYKNKDESLNADPLASAHGTAAFERIVELILNLDGHPKRVRCRCPKNRLGGEDFEVFFTFDMPRKRLLELDQVAEAVVEQEKVDHEVDACAERVLEFIQKNPGCTSRQIRENVKGSPKAIEAGRKRLIERGYILFDPGQRGACYWKLANNVTSMRAFKNRGDGAPSPTPTPVSDAATPSPGTPPDVPVPPDEVDPEPDLFDEEE